MNSSLNNNSGVQFADQENTIIDSNIVQIQPHWKWNYFRFSGAILNCEVKKSSVKVGTGTVEKLALENMDTASGILSLGGAEPDIYLGVIYPPSHPSCNVYVFKIPLQH